MGRNFSQYCNFFLFSVGWIEERGGGGVSVGGGFTPQEAKLPIVFFPITNTSKKKDDH